MKARVRRGGRERGFAPLTVGAWGAKYGYVGERSCPRLRPITEGMQR